MVMIEIITCSSQSSLMNLGCCCFPIISWMSAAILSVTTVALLLIDSLSFSISIFKLSFSALSFWFSACLTFNVVARRLVRSFEIGALCFAGWFAYSSSYASLLFMLAWNFEQLVHNTEESRSIRQLRDL